MISIARGALDLRDAGRSGSSDFLGAVECVTGLEHKKNNLPYQCLPWRVDGDGVERNNEEGGIDSVDLYTKTLQNAGRFQDDNGGDLAAAMASPPAFPVLILNGGWCVEM